MKVNPSALKHGVSEADVLHAAQNWAYASDPDDDMPAKQFVLGFDRSGRLLELAIPTLRQRAPTCDPLVTTQHRRHPRPGLRLRPD